MYATYLCCNLVPLISANDHHDHEGHGNDHHSIANSHQGHATGTDVETAHVNHGDEHQSNADSHDHDSHSHEHEGSTDDCCNDLTSSLLDALPKLSLKQLHFQFAIGHGLVLQSYLVLDKTVLAYEPKFVRYIQPPPKVPDIRIFIQSFII